MNLSLHLFCNFLELWHHGFATSRTKQQFPKFTMSTESVSNTPHQIHHRKRTKGDAWFHGTVPLEHVHWSESAQSSVLVVSGRCSTTRCEFVSGKDVNQHGQQLFSMLLHLVDVAVHSATTASSSCDCIIQLLQTTTFLLSLQPTAKITKKSNSLKVTRRNNEPHGKVPLSLHSRSERILTTFRRKRAVVDLASIDSFC